MQPILTLLAIAFSVTVLAQSEKPANVYPSNLEENMYYEKYDASTATIKGVYFLVLSDGDNSQDFTPSFKVTLYLMPEGSSNASDIIRVKTFPLKGIYHMGSHEFKNINLPLKNLEGLYAGNYRLGIWVNSEEDFSENTSDNAILFKGVIPYDPEAPTKAPASEPASPDEEDNSSDEGDLW